MLTDINAGILHRMLLVVIININGSEVSTAVTLLSSRPLVLPVNEDDVVITGLPLLLLSVEDDVLLHLVTGAVVITRLLLLNIYISINYM